MNMFDDAKFKAKINNLPTHYDPVRSGRVYKISANHISHILINDEMTVH